MRLRAALALLVCPLAACSSAPRFSLDALRDLRLGSSTSEDLDLLLGPPAREPGPRRAVYETAGKTVSPPAPLSFICWPIYVGVEWRRYEVDVEFDERRRARDASITVKGGTFAAFLIFIQPHGHFPRLEPGELEILRELRSRGIRVIVGLEALP